MFRNSAFTTQRLYKQRGIGLPAVIFIITTLVLIIAAMAQLQQNTSDGLKPAGVIATGVLRGRIRRAAEHEFIVAA